MLGGDCSLLIGAGVANARGPRGGLVHIDGHTAFRHPGNSDEVASVGGEALAAAIGRHRPAISDVGGLSPCFDPARTVHLGCRDDDDEELAEVTAALAPPAAGAAVTVFDPDLDPDGRHALLLTDVLVDGFGALGSAHGEQCPRI